jgi:diaminopimelate decarboxylase
MFSYNNNQLEWKSVPMEATIEAAAAKLAADFQYTGPFWLYQEEILTDRIKRLETGLPGCSFYYSVKSQSNLSLLKIVASHGRFGADVVSGGELYRALKAGFSPDKIVFAGVGKTANEIAAALDFKIRSFHVESISELQDIGRIAPERSTVAPVSLRLNPDVEVDTHRHITTGKEENKFGLSEADFVEALQILRSSTNLKLVGLQAHIGSQIFEVEPYTQTAKFLQLKYEQVRVALGQNLEYISLGGGFGVDYTALEGDGTAYDFTGLMASISDIFGKDIEIHFEPGRFVSAPSGVLVSRVRHIKHRATKTIAIIDAAMNDLIRPMLYEAYHPVLPVSRRQGERLYDIVGPICESTDTFASERTMPALAENDWLVVGYAGAYGSCMSSNYNSRPFIPELLLNGKDLVTIRKPQTLEQMLATEIV